MLNVLSNISSNVPYPWYIALYHMLLRSLMFWKHVGSSTFPSSERTLLLLYHLVFIKSPTSTRQILFHFQIKMLKFMDFKSFKFPKWCGRLEWVSSDHHLVLLTTTQCILAFQNSLKHFLVLLCVVFDRSTHSFLPHWGSVWMAIHTRFSAHELENHILNLQQFILVFTCVLLISCNGSDSE